jgi:hypothetical protein
LATADAAEYTYLTLPSDRALISCVGLVVAGLAARAKIGVAALEEAVELLEGQQAANGPTRYRFSLMEDGLLAEVEERKTAPVRGEPSSWRTVVELIS